MREKQTSIFDLLAGREARDAGMAQVAAHAEDWIDIALRGIASLPIGYEGTAEEICATLNLAEPHHYNAIGSMIRQAQRKGMLTRTGRLRPCRKKRSHARQAMIWRKR